MLVLLFFWSIAQPLAVINSVAIDLRIHLYFWKNVLGAVVIGYGLTVILINLSQRRYPLIYKKLFWLSMLFPSYSLFNMLFRGYGTSIEEQALYFLWPLALFVVFPAFFPTDTQRRRGVFVVWLSNIIALSYGIIQGVGDESFVSWLDYRYRVSFDFFQPNIYSSSWAMVFATSIYLFLSIRTPRKRKIFLLLGLLALLFIFLARSESVLLFCIGIILAFLLNNKWDKRVRISILMLTMAVTFGTFSNSLDRDTLNTATSSRISVWERTWQLNMQDASFFSYLVGKSSLIQGNITYSGERVGFYATRAQTDNVYLALFLQNGLVGLSLFFCPLLIMFSQLVNAIGQSGSSTKKLNVWVLGVWIGIFLEIFGLATIPSFGNVANIFLFVSSAPAIIQIAKQQSLIKISSNLAIGPRYGTSYARKI